MDERRRIIAGMSEEELILYALIGGKLDNLSAARIADAMDRLTHEGHPTLRQVWFERPKERRAPDRLPKRLEAKRARMTQKKAG